MSGFETTPRAGDEGDWCYVKDIARGIQLLQSSGDLQHAVFNVGSGCSVSNAEITEAAVKLRVSRARTSSPRAPTW